MQVPTHQWRVAALRDRRNRRGVALLYGTILMVVLIAFASLAVDVGVVRVTQHELQRTADAAALYAVRALPGSASSAISRAIVSGAENSAYGLPVVINPGDVLTGNWNTTTHVFTANGSPLNAVKVSAVRVAARNTAVPLACATILGLSTCDVHTSSIASIIPAGDSYGIAGMDYFRSQGLLTVDSYPSGSGASIVTEGDVTLNLLGLVGLTNICGDVHPGIGKSINKPLLLPALTTRISGSTSQLGTTLNYPSVDATNPSIQNDNSGLPASCMTNKNFTGAIITDIPAGTYCVNDFTLAANVLLRVNGPTTFYVTGKTTMLGSVLVTGNDPSNFKVRVAGSDPVDLAANTMLCCDMYAPDAPIRITAGLGYYGGLIGKSIDILATSFIHYKEGLQTYGSTATASLVK